MLFAHIRGLSVAASVVGAFLNTVRIIGGEWRRRILRFPVSEGLRPTPDRVRETVFNWLGQDLTGQTCLDLFAGSGAFGFEAASRGARRVVLLEKAPSVVAALRMNARQLAVPGGEVALEIRAGDALQYAASALERFDVVFLDPPYRCGWIEKLAVHMERLLKPEATLYVETEYAIKPGAHLFPGWQVVRYGKAGDVHFHLMRQEENDAE